MRTRSKKGSKPKTKAIVVQRKVAPVKYPLSPEGKKYMALVADPCNSALTTSPYDTSAGTVITRSNNNVALGPESHITVLAFHPLLGTYMLSGTSDPDEAQIFKAVAGTKPEGTGRAIAGCASTTWVGTEADRQGMLYCDVVPGAMIWNYLQISDGGGNLSISPNNIIAKMTNMERMPVDKCEVTWFPSEGDCEMSPPIIASGSSVQATEVTFSKTQFTLTVISAGGDGKAIMYKTVSIVEFTQSLVPSSKLSWAISPKIPPTFSWKDVISQLTSKDPAWYINTFRKVGTLVAGAAASYATAGLPGALGFLTQSIAGIKITRDRVRSN